MCRYIFVIQSLLEFVLFFALFLLTVADGLSSVLLVFSHRVEMACDYSSTVCAPAWLNNCVGHHNHRHFFLFCVYMCVGCFYVSMSGYPLFKEHFYGVQVSHLHCYFVIFSIVLLLDAVIVLAV